MILRYCLQVQEHLRRVQQPETPGVGRQQPGAQQDPAPGLRGQ